MDTIGTYWYKSCMAYDPDVPKFALYGETTAFPDVIHCERYSERAKPLDWRIGAHRHGQMVQIFVISQGRADAIVNDVPLTVESGFFLFVPEYCVHEFVFEPDTVGDVISIPTRILASIGPATETVLSRLSTPMSGPIDVRLRTLTDLLIDMGQRQSAFRAQQVIGLAHSVLAYLAELSAEQDSENPNAPRLRMFALETLIKDKLADGWRASDYASALSMTAGHLSRICRAATGLGAAAFIEEKRMEEACRMLAFTALPISEIGYRLSYADPSHFSKRFRAARGQTPSQYRATVKAHAQGSAA